MDPKKKEDILEDIVKFKTGKEYYCKIGKAWKVVIYFSVHQEPENLQ